MENFPQQNQKEELNIDEKIVEYKGFIDLLREKYSDLLDGSYKFVGAPGDDGFNGMQAVVESSPTKPDRINWSIEKDDTDKLAKIRGFIIENTKGDLNHKAPLDPFRYGGEALGSHRLDWWLDAYGNGLDFITSPENIVD